MLSKELGLKSSIPSPFLGYFWGLVFGEDFEHQFSIYLLLVFVFAVAIFLSPVWLFVNPSFEFFDPSFEFFDSFRLVVFRRTTFEAKIE